MIQQGLDPIAGWSDRKPFCDYSDIILFGDHTLSVYLPTSPFLLATDGLKIIIPTREMISREFLMVLFEKYGPKSEGYKRHFTILKNQYAYFPLDKSEQNKISNLFVLLRELEKALDTKMNTLKKYKEGLVNDWFSNDSNKVQLKSLVNQKPSSLLKSHFKENSGQYPVYDASGQPYTTINFYNNDQDSVAIIKYGSGCGNTFITRNKHNVLGTMSELIPKDKELLEYIYAYTLSKQFRKICTRYTEIGTTPNLYYSDYSEEYVYIPKDKDKTKKFIEIFTNLEKEESICQKKLIILGQIKSQLLKSMFI